MLSKGSAMRLSGAPVPQAAPATISYNSAISTCEGKISYNSAVSTCEGPEKHDCFFDYKSLEDDD